MFAFATVGAGVSSLAVAVAVGVVRVVLADVEAVGQGALTILIFYKSAHISPAFLRRGGELALDDAVGDGNLGIVSYTFNYARRVASAIVTAARDVHRADAARDGGGAKGFVNQS